MSQVQTCPRHHPSTPAEGGHSAAGAPSLRAAPSAPPSRDDGGRIAAVTASGGWWAFCARASSVEARA